MTKFEEMLPRIESEARFGLRRLSPEKRAEACAEVVAHAYIMFCKLEEKGRLDLAYPTVLASYAIGRERAGVLASGGQNEDDITSRRHAIRHGCKRTLLDTSTVVCGLLSNDDDPAETVPPRLDYAEWKASQSARDQELLDDTEDVGTHAGSRRFADRQGWSTAHHAKKILRGLADRWEAHSVAPMRSE